MHNEDMYLLPIKLPAKRQGDESSVESDEWDDRIIESIKSEDQTSF